MFQKGGVNILRICRRLYPPQCWRCCCCLPGLEWLIFAVHRCPELPRRSRAAGRGLTQRQSEVRLQGAQELERSRSRSRELRRDNLYCFGYNLVIRLSWAAARVSLPRHTDNDTGRSRGADVFVTDANAIRGLDASQIADGLTIPISPSGFNVIEFLTPEASLLRSTEQTRVSLAVGQRQVVCMMCRPQWAYPHKRNHNARSMFNKGNAK